MPTLAVNKQARHEYKILETYEAGVSLTGAEVKSVRAGHINLKGCFATLKDGGLWLLNAHISRYAAAGPQPGYDPVRTRALLLHAREIGRLAGHLKEKGLTLIPLSIYTKGNRIKVELGLGRGNKQYEKREIIKKRDIDRDIRSILKLSR